MGQIWRDWHLKMGLSGLKKARMAHSAPLNSEWSGGSPSPHHGALTSGKLTKLGEGAWRKNRLYRISQIGKRSVCPRTSKSGNVPSVPELPSPNFPELPEFPVPEFPVPEFPASFMAESDHWIDVHSTARGNPACDESHHKQERGGCYKRQRIVGAYSK